ncbi:MAG: RDD family protein [Mycoplasmataceae bacterium]|nr:RDD family protein [Mycoplasmataceae bacterium]
MATKINLDVNGRAFYYTGEGKIVYPAGAWKRMLVRVVDFIIAILPSIIFSIVYVTAYYQEGYLRLFEPSSNWSFILSQVLAVVGPIIMFMVIPILWDGQTLMKKIFRIQPMFMDGQSVWKGVLIRESIVTLVAIIVNLIILCSGIDYLTAFSEYNVFINDAGNAILKLTGGETSGFQGFYLESHSTDDFKTLMSDMDKYLSEMDKWYSTSSSDVIKATLTGDEKRAYDILVDINSFEAFDQGLLYFDGNVLILNSNNDSFKEFINSGWNDMITSYAQNVASAEPSMIVESKLNASYSAFIIQIIQRIWWLLLFVAIGVSKGKLGIHDIAAKTVIVDLNRMYKPTTANVGDNPDESKLKPIADNKDELPTVEPSHPNDVSKTGSTIIEEKTTKENSVKKDETKKDTKEKPTETKKDSETKKNKPKITTTKDGSVLIEPTFKDDITKKGNSNKKSDSDKTKK